MKRKFLVKNIFNGYTFIEDKVLVIEDGTILGVQKRIDAMDDEVIDKRNYILSPGFVDKHTHGIGGVDFFNVDAKDLKTIQNHYFKHGVTTIVPTIVSAPFDRIFEFAKSLKAVKSESDFLLNIPGIFLEGPFINSEKKGAHDERFLQKPSVEKLEELISNCPEKIVDIAIAPELENANDFISKAFYKYGINVSLGHSNAGFEKTKQSHASGAKNIIHLFNAMPQLHHRSSSITTYALLSDIMVEIIADLTHVSREMVSLAYRLKGAENMILISDSISATCLDDGIYTLGSLDVKVENGVCTLFDGTIAGSTLTLDRAVKNIVQIGIKKEDALRMATANPAKLLNIKAGEIKKGHRADFVLLDNELNVKEVYIGGELIFSQM